GIRFGTTPVSRKFSPDRNRRQCIKACDGEASFLRQAQDRLGEPGRSGVSPLRCFQKAAGGRFYFGVAGVPPSGFELPSDLDGVYALGVTNNRSGDVADVTLARLLRRRKVADRNPCNVHTMHASSYG